MRITKRPTVHVVSLLLGFLLMTCASYSGAAAGNGKELSLEKAVQTIKKVQDEDQYFQQDYANVEILSGVLQEENKAYVWFRLPCISKSGLKNTTKTTTAIFHRYNDGRWVLHATENSSRQNLVFIPVE